MLLLIAITAGKPQQGVLGSVSQEPELDDGGATGSSSS